MKDTLEDHYYSARTRTHPRRDSPLMPTLLDRFLRYVKIDTQADETSTTYPSTAKQLTLSRLLADECRALGLADVMCDEFGIVLATVPSTVSHAVPVIAYVAHVDTSPEYSSTNVSPIVHEPRWPCSSGCA